jgi:Terpene cyclase DEP1
MPRLILLIVLACFGALSAAALRDHGVLGIIAPHFQSFGGAQVFADLVIALTLATVWIVRDARAAQRNPWPWVALTLATGSFGPLLYLLTRQPSPAQQRPAAMAA